MAVIAKMDVREEPRDYGSGTKQLQLHCVCDDKLMAYTDECKADNLEDKTFNDASPSGDAIMQVPHGFPVARQEKFYLIFERQPDCPPFDNAELVCKLRVNGITDYGGTSKTVEMFSAYGYGNTMPPYHDRQIDSFNLKMMIDNPKASVQFEPGAEGYWVGIYRCDKFTMQEALADALA